MILFLIAVIAAYALGSISSGVIVAKFLKLSDPRTTGSGNPGATNLLRLGGKKAALLCLIGDVLKGFVAILFAKLLTLSGGTLGWVVLAAVLGHMYPCFFQFQGGKGVATMFGGVYAISFLLGIFITVVWIVVAIITRFSSFASLCATATLVLFAGFLTRQSGFLLPFLVLAIMIALRHKENIKRLLDGTEPKVSFKKFK